MGKGIEPVQVPRGDVECIEQSTLIHDHLLHCSSMQLEAEVAQDLRRCAKVLHQASRSRHLGGGGGCNS